MEQEIILSRFKLAKPKAVMYVRPDYLEKSRPWFKAGYLFSLKFNRTAYSYLAAIGIDVRRKTDNQKDEIALKYLFPLIESSYTEADLENSFKRDKEKKN